MQSCDQLQMLNRRYLQTKKTPNLSEMPKDQKRLAIGARASAMTLRNCSAIPIFSLRFLYCWGSNGAGNCERFFIFDVEIRKGRGFLRNSVGKNEAALGANEISVEPRTGLRELTEH